MKITKIENGITLIALIITIVVLLILATVAITAMTRYDIIENAEGVVRDYEEEGRKESGLLSAYNTVIDQYLGGSTSGEGTLGGDSQGSGSTGTGSEGNDGSEGTCSHERSKLNQFYHSSPVYCGFDYECLDCGRLWAPDTFPIHRFVDVSYGKECEICGYPLHDLD